MTALNSCRGALPTSRSACRYILLSRTIVKSFSKKLNINNMREVINCPRTRPPDAGFDVPGIGAEAAANPRRALAIASVQKDLSLENLTDTEGGQKAATLGRLRDADLPSPILNKARCESLLELNADVYGCSRSMKVLRLMAALGLA